MSSSAAIIVSTALLLAGVLGCARRSPSRLSAAVSTFLALGSALLLLFCGGIEYFTGNGIDHAALYHLRYGLQGAGFGEYWRLILVGSFLLLIVVLALGKLIPRAVKATEWKPADTLALLFSYAALLASIVLNPATADLYRLQVSPGIGDARDSKEARSDFGKYYQHPRVEKTRDSEKNLVFIYAESLERTYFDESVFPGLVPNLREIERQAVSYTNIRQIKGTQWTIGGMTASQCGIPLFTPSHGNSMSGMDRFLSGATCMGDILREQGFQLAYYGGASLNFAGKGPFFRTHGFDEVRGYHELKETVEDRDYMTSWGLYDDTLFDILYRRFKELSESGERFGLFALTLDTHHPRGHSSKSCGGLKYKDGSNPILNAVACSDLVVSRFIDRVKSSPYAENTLIVLVSDHLAMKNTAWDMLKKRGKRRNLFLVIDPENHAPRTIDTLGSTLDIGTTLLPYLGYAGNIALGRDLSDPAPDHLPVSRHIHKSVVKWREPLSAFWDFPTLEEELAFDMPEKAIMIDNQKFKVPVLVEFNDRLETTLKFEFDRSPAHKTLAQHREELPEGRYFFLVDYCRNHREFRGVKGRSELCAMWGKGRRHFDTQSLEDSLAYSAPEVRDRLNICGDSHSGPGGNCGL